MKTEKLHISFDDIFDYRLVGISSQERDYRLCWAINQLLHIDMVRVPDHLMESRAHIAGFPFFECIQEETGDVYRLLSNRFEQKILMKELKTIDYFLLIQTQQDFIADVIHRLTTLEFVIWASEIDVNQLKEKDLLYLDE